MIWLTADDVVKLHSKVIQSTGGLDGLRDRAGLEAALAAPLQTFGGEDLFPGDVDKIARLGFGLASNHVFLDGNKRIGALVLEGFQGDRFLLIAQPGLPVKWVDSKCLACYNTIKFDRAGDTYGTAL